MSKLSEYLEKVYNEYPFDLAQSGNKIIVYKGSYKENKPLGNITASTAGKVSAAEVATLLEKVREKFPQGNVVTDIGIKNFVAANKDGISVSNNILELDLVPPKEGSPGEVKIINQKIA